MNNKPRSPLKDKPLRYVAQSADEAIDDLLNDKIFFYLVGATITIMSVINEWLRFYTPLEKPPILITIIGGLLCIICIYKIITHFKKLKNLKLGRDGERAVGQYLELFRESGCHVFHDIIGNSFNVDHVLISTKGLFVIETKTYSKPATGNSKIHFNGKEILINGNSTHSDIITQATAATAFIQKVLKNSTGKDFLPFPVVLFPGWYVEGDGNNQGRMWVLEPKAFKKFVDRQTQKYSPEDVALMSYHLSRHIRTSKK
jgi:hypothetical protein